jgi:hypothetical protein
MDSASIRILGKHQQSIDLIRSLAVTAHALDLSAEDLFLTGTYSRRSPATKATYDALLSTNLLHLAVAVRTNIYQGSLSGDSKDFVSHCGFLDVETGGKQQSRDFSIKDVCDKIVHADEVFRELESLGGSSRTTTIIRGTHKRNRWELSISVGLFCEALLNWLDIASEKSADPT